MLSIKQNTTLPRVLCVMRSATRRVDFAREEKLQQSWIGARGMKEDVRTGLGKRLRRDLLSAFVLIPGHGWWCNIVPSSSTVLDHRE